MIVVKTTRARSTGSVISVIDNRDGSFEAHEGLQGNDYSDMRWATVCETHRNYCLHSTRSLAITFASAPEEWCEKCQDLM